MSDPSQNPYIHIGSVSKAHGIRGELSIVSYAEADELFEGTVFLAAPNITQSRFPQYYPATVQSMRSHHNGLLVTLAGVKSREQAESLRGYDIFVKRERLPELDEDEFYLTDLIGFTVAVLDEHGKESNLGIIEDVDDPAGQILWTIKTTNGVEVLFPAVDEFIEDINMDSRVAIISPPPGLIELYLSGDAL